MENWLHPELPKTENERFRQYLESKENGKGYEKDMTIFIDFNIQIIMD